VSSRPQFNKEANFGYDLSRWPEREYQRLTFDNVLGLPFTLSSGTEILRVVDTFQAGTNRFPVYDFPTFISSSTNLTLLYEADDTDFTRKYQFTPVVDCIIDRIEWNIGMGHNVSAYTSGTFRLSSVNINLSTYKAPGQLVDQRKLKYGAGMAAMTSTGDNQIAIVNTAFQGPFVLYGGGIMEIDFNIDGLLGVGTYQKGIMATFPYQNTGGDREYSVSGFKIYFRPNPTQVGNVYTPTTYASFVGMAQQQGTSTSYIPSPKPDASTGGFNT
jgi:hypothetical protein